MKMIWEEYISDHYKGHRILNISQGYPKEVNYILIKKDHLTIFNDLSYENNLPGKVVATKIHISILHEF